MKSQLQLLLNLSLAKKEESNFTTFTPYYLVSPLVYLQIFGKVSLGYIWKFAWFIWQCISVSHSVLLLLIRATVVCFMFYLFSQYMCEVLQRICTLLDLQVQLSDRGPVCSPTLTHGSEGCAAGEWLCPGGQEFVKVMVLPKRQLVQCR